MKGAKNQATDILDHLNVPAKTTINKVLLKSNLATEDKTTNGSQ